MKLDITSLYFNGETKSVGNTASWGTALGQERPDYPISVEGGKDLVDLINLNHFDFIPLKDANHTANIKNLQDKIIYASGKFDTIYVNNIEFQGPFFLLVIKETSGSHAGRKSLKYNNKIKVYENSNESFYKSLSEYFGIESCWFVHDISAIKGQLHMSAIKVDDKPMIYEDAKERKDHWESLINDFSDVKKMFKTYLLDVHELKHESTANEYLKSMPKIEKWFKDNHLCSLDYQIFNIRNDNSKINTALDTNLKNEWKELNQKERGWYGTPWNRWLEFIIWYNDSVTSSTKKDHMFNLNAFSDSCKLAGLVYSDKLITRFVSSLLTKPFVILTGLSGSGKTKLAQAYVQWICQEESQYRIIPVGADWTNREPLLGYPNALKPEEYVKPDSGVIDLIIQANSNPELPHFLILDEMNLSHVERYFADFLSVMESNEEIPLYAERTVNNGVPSKLKVPANLFIIGTVNIDETTNMFSPKVLDRANTIEFRINNNEMEGFLSSANDLNMKALLAKGATMAQSFISLSNNKSFTTKDLNEINKTLLNFFGELQKTGAEFGYRSATEILRLINQLDTLNNKITTSEKIDIAIMQKLLPKLHGSRRKLSPILETLGSFCLTEDIKVVKEVFDKDDFDYSNDKVLYPLSLEKIARMYKGAVDNGFASYAEA